jgi:hypothetical protein
LVPKFFFEATRRAGSAAHEQINDAREFNRPSMSSRAHLFRSAQIPNSELTPMNQTTSRSDRNANVPAALAEQHMVEQYTAEQNLAEQNPAGQRDDLLDKQKPVAR